MRKKLTFARSLLISPSGSFVSSPSQAIQLLLLASALVGTWGAPSILVVTSLGLRSASDSSLRSSACSLCSSLGVTCAWWSNPQWSILASSGRCVWHPIATTSPTAPSLALRARWIGQGTALNALFVLVCVAANVSPLMPKFAKLVRSSRLGLKRVQQTRSRHPLPNLRKLKSAKSKCPENTCFYMVSGSFRLCIQCFLHHFICLLYVATHYLKAVF